MDDYKINNDGTISIENSESTRSYFSSAEGVKNLRKFAKISYFRTILGVILLAAVLVLLFPIAMTLSTSTFDATLAEIIEVISAIFAVTILITSIVVIVQYFSSLREMSVANNFFAEAYQIRRKQFIVGLVSNVAGNALSNSKSIIGKAAGGAIKAANGIYSIFKDLEFYNALHFGLNVELKKIGREDLVAKCTKTINRCKDNYKLSVGISLLFLMAGIIMVFIGSTSLYSYVMTGAFIMMVVAVIIAAIIGYATSKILYEYLNETSNAFEATI